MSNGLLYEVTLEIDPTAADEIERYMRQKHIPEIWATGCFRRICFDRAGPTAFRTCYEAASSDDLERYLRDHAAHYRADFLQHFPTGVSVTRLTWSPLARWP